MPRTLIAPLVLLKHFQTMLIQYTVKLQCHTNNINTIPDLSTPQKLIKKYEPVTLLVTRHFMPRLKYSTVLVGRLGCHQRNRYARQEVRSIHTLEWIRAR